MIFTLHSKLCKDTEIRILKTWALLSLSRKMNPKDYFVKRWHTVTLKILGYCRHACCKFPAQCRPFSAQQLLLLLNVNICI
jgi:hypothetical protein